MQPLEILQKIRAESGAARVTGLSDETVTRFLESDPDLATAIEWAGGAFACLPVGGAARPDRRR